MNEHTPQATPRRSGAGRIALILGAAVAAVLALGALGLGAAALIGEGLKDDDGYLATDSERFAAGTRALATEDLDVDLDGAEWMVKESELGRVRLEVQPRNDKPVFVGIARADDVSAYLSGVEHTRVTDIDSDPFEAAYERRAGGEVPARPSREPFWARSVQGRGAQTLTWDAEDGDWSIVVMNADGSPGVDADVSAGAKVPFLDELGWTLVGGGVALLALAVALLSVALRPPRPPRHAAPAAAAA
jgi:hypothetical protein